MSLKKFGVGFLTSLSITSFNAQANLQHYLKKSLNHPFLSLVAVTQTPNGPPEPIALGITKRTPPTKASAESLYRIASSTKPFIATTVIKLAIAHKLSLNDKLTQYLGPKYLHGIQNADQVTIKQLLGMESGIYNYTDNPAFLKFVDKYPKHKWTPMDALNFARNKPRIFTPGTSSKYSNTNYILLGLVIEKASGHSLVHELNALIFKPLHLKHTFLEEHQPIPHPIATSYVYLGDGLYRKVTANDGYGLADGGIVSNAYDLNTFIRNLMLNRKFMPLAWLKKMTDFHPMFPIHPIKTRHPIGYGLGLIRFQFGKLVLIGHDGDDTGRQSWMVFDPVTHKSLALITNTRPPYLDERKIGLATFSTPRKKHN